MLKRHPLDRVCVAGVIRLVLVVVCSLCTFREESVTISEPGGDSTTLIKTSKTSYFMQSRRLPNQEAIYCLYNPSDLIYTQKVNYIIWSMSKHIISKVCLFDIIQTYEAHSCFKSDGFWHHVPALHFIQPNACPWPLAVSKIMHSTCALNY